MTTGINNKGNIPIVGIIFMIIAIIIVMIVLPTGINNLKTANTDGATSFLTSRGYVVLASGEYALIAKEATAAAAVANAEAAVLTSEAILDTLLLHNENLVYLYPEETTSDVIITSGNGVDTWTANWTVVTDGVTSLSAKISANAAGATYVYLTEITCREYHTADIMSIIEISYGDAHTVVGRVKVRSDFTYVLILKSAKIPVGQEIYYRMKSELALEHTTVDFRYYYQP